MYFYMYKYTHKHSTYIYVYIHLTCEYFFPAFTTSKYILICTNIHLNTHMPCLHFIYTQMGNEDKGKNFFLIL